MTGEDGQGGLVQGRTLFARGLLAVLFGVFYIGYLARKVGVEGMATISLLSMLYGLLPLVILLAMPTAIQRFIAESVGRRDTRTTDALLRTCLRLSTTLSVLGLATGLMAFPLLSSYLFPGSGILLSLLLAIAAATFIASSLLASIFFGFQLYQRYALFSSLGAVWGQATSIFLLLAGYGIPAFITSWVVDNMVVIVALTATVPKPSANNQSPYSMLPLVAYSIPFFASTLVPYLVGDVFIRLYIFETLRLTDLGLYEAASRIAAIPKMYETTLLVTLFPYLARVFGVGGNTTLGRGVGWTCRVIALVFAPILTGLALVSEPLFSIVFGQAFSGSIPIFLLLLASAMLNFLASPFNLGLQALGRTRDVFIIQVAASWACLGTTLLLSRFGIIGIVIGAETLGLVASALSVYAFWQRVSAPIEVSPKLLAMILLAALSMVPPVYVVSLALPRYRFVPIRVLVGVVTYFLAVRQLRLLSREDLLMVGAMLPPRLGRSLLRIFGYE